jgi:succinate dehydrogenase / fumarate reductase iron-sulfur subunit
MCGSCNSVCNCEETDRQFLGPSALSKAWRITGDVREGEKKRRLARLSMEHGMWDCVRCYNCTEFCPKDVRPLEAIENLRQKAIEQGLTDNAGAKHTLSLVDSVKRVGRLDEAAMTFRSLGFLRSIGMIPFGLKMAFHGKMPHPIILPKIDNIEEVKKIYRAVGKKGAKK